MNKEVASLMNNKLLDYNCNPRIISAVIAVAGGFAARREAMAEGEKLKMENGKLKI